MVHAKPVKDRFPQPKEEEGAEDGQDVVHITGFPDGKLSLRGERFAQGNRCA